MSMVSIAITVVMAGLAGFSSRYGIADWQYWLTTIPVCAWIGLTTNLAFRA